MTAAQSRALEELLPRYGVQLAALARPEQAFAHRAPLHLEIGIGNGDNLVALAAASPSRNYLGCEVHRPGLGHALHCTHDAGLTNLRLLDADAGDVLRALPAAALDGVAMFFPDPWPKKRHHKRRLLNAAMLTLIATRLKACGRFCFATDDPGYAEVALELFEDRPEWFNLAGHRQWAPRPHTRIVTRFEARAMHAGRAVYDLVAALA